MIANFAGSLQHRPAPPSAALSSPRVSQQQWQVLPAAPRFHLMTAQSLLLGKPLGDALRSNCNGCWNCVLLFCFPSPCGRRSAALSKATS